MDPEEAAELRKSLVAAAGDDEHALAPTGIAMTRDEAILRLADRLPENAFASVHLSEVALATRDAAADLRAGKAARFSREWSVLITAPGYQHNHAGDDLGAVVEQALAEYVYWRQARDADEWARSAIPEKPPKPPKLLAPGTAEEERERGREKDAG
jgi:hypothetical protein